MLHAVASRGSGPLRQITLKDLGYKFPNYPVPPGETMDSFLYARTWEGARRRYQPVTDKVIHQLDRELKLIEKLGLAGYFLIVWDHSLLQ